MKGIFDFDVTKLLDHITRIEDFGPLPSDSFNFDVQKSSDGRICLMVNAKSMAKRSNKPKGTLEIAKDKIVFSDAGGAEICFHGALVKRQQHSKAESGYGHFWKLTIVFSQVTRRATNQKHIVSTTVETVHLPKNIINFWPHMTSTTHTESREMEIRGTSLRFDTKKDNESHSGNALNLEVNGRQVSLLCENSTDERGYLCFEGNPTKEERDKIRWSLSFALGHQLVHFGHYKLTIKNLRTEIMFVSKQTIPSNSGFTKQPSTQRITDIQKIVTGLMRNYDRLDLSYILFSYFDARTAKEEKKGVYYGAAIEALQKTYEASHTRISAKIVSDKKLKKKFFADYKTLVKNLKLDLESEKLLLDKVSFLNSAPQKEVVRRFFNSLGLGLRKVELNAWQRRNDAAHGNKSNKGTFEDLILDNIALCCMFNRFLLSVATDCHLYTDYHTIGHVQRHVATAIPDR
ncbi:hypothetical protein ABF162_01045 [Vibrio coralliilyticus]|uniref:hypothetical protein n=1 Tax=Vibrio coralliilyticus TaxID=190893 RepID=UPI0005127F9D|nr:hypothetical protein [Vibrio coralliilyticus]AIS53759.1 hypothetical protein JV59_00965 [Vibrio coralliilyticus]